MRAGTAHSSLELPDDAAAQTAFAPGLWQLGTRVTPAGRSGRHRRNENGIALPLAPDPVIAADPVLGLPAVSLVRGGSPLQVTVTLRSRPQVRLGQRATLTLDAITAEAAPRAAAADPLVLRVPNSLPDGNRWVRLRVDGVDSPLVLRKLFRRRNSMPSAEAHGAGMNASTVAMNESAIVGWPARNQRWLSETLRLLARAARARPPDPIGTRRLPRRFGRDPTDFQPPALRNPIPVRPHDVRNGAPGLLAAGVEIDAALRQAASRARST